MSANPHRPQIQKETPQGMVSVAEILAYVNQDRYLSLPEACEYLSLSERTIRELLPGIPHARVGRRLLFKKSKLDGWVQTHEEAGEDLVLDALAEAAANDILGARGNRKL